MKSDEKKEFWEDDSQDVTRRPIRKPSSIKSILIFTAVVAATAVCIGQLVRAVNSGGEGTAVGQFAILNAMMPTLFVVAAYWFFKIFGKFIE